MSRLKSLSYFLFDISHLLNINYDNNLHSNIVECKSRRDRRKGSGNISELIETLWNVNERYFVIVSLYNCELIETLWNVNKMIITAVAG